jgi:hypothetical protein
MASQPLHDPPGHLFALGEIRYLVQTIQEEEEIASPQQTFAKALRSLEMGAVQLLLDKRIEPLGRVSATRAAARRPAACLTAGR